MSDLPQHWITTTIGEVIVDAVQREPDNDENFCYIDISSINRETKRISNPKQMLGQHVPSRARKVVQSGDVLVSLTRPNLNAVALVPENLDGQIASTGFDVLRAVNIDPRWLFYLVQTIDFVESMSGLVQGVLYPAIRSKDVRAFKVPLAPSDEQKRIANKLDSLLARVNACRKRLDHVPRILQRFRQAVLAAATSGKLTKDWRAENEALGSVDGIEEELTDFNFKDAACFGDFRFPTSWNVSQLGEIAEIVAGITKDSKKQAPTDGELPYLRVANVQRGFLDLSEIKTIRVPQDRVEELLLNRGDILFNEGGDIDKIGRGWVWNGEIERCTFQNHVFRVRLYNELFEPKFFSWYGNSRGANYFLSVGKQTTNLASINKSLLSALPVVIPPAAEQQEIVRLVDLLFACADRLEARHRNAFRQVEQTTSALLSTAFRGELIPQDPNDEPASVLLEKIQAERLRMKSEQKTTHTVRRTTKEKPKAPVRQTLDDYVKALRSASEQLGGKADARQLFDQAGFNPEETVQFYEALRAIPEVRDAFKNALQEQLLQKQSSVARIADNSLSENGHFRLVELWLEDFKNLADYTVHFDPSHSIDIVLGWNGTGKSNLFEALVIIFRDLHRWSEKNQWTQKPMK
nr:restriction endonuclease subunit S [Nostocaceae cyanobacterium]